MGFWQAFILILQVVKEAGGFQKFAELLTRHREEILRMRDDLPEPKHSKGY